MGAFLQRLLPGVAGDHAAEMRRVEQHQRPDLVGDRPDLADGMRQKVEAAADGDHLRPHLKGEFAQPGDIDRVAIAVDRRGMDVEPIEPGAAGHVMRDMAADGGRRHDHAVARPRRGDEGIEIGDGAGRHADLGIAGAEHLGGELGRDDLDALDALQPHLVFVAGIAERRARAEARGKRRLGSGVHHVGRRIEVDAIGLMDAPVERDARLDRRKHDVAPLPARFRGQPLDEILALRGNPGPASKSGHQCLHRANHQRSGWWRRWYAGANE